MADSHDKIMALVEAALKKNPDATTEELQTAAKKRFPSAGKLSKRQFNGRYALQVKRKNPRVRTGKKAAAKAPRRSRKQPAATPAPARRTRLRRTETVEAKAATFDRDAVRQQFLKFASDITAADSRRDLVRVLAGVDKYVDAVAKASR